MKKIFLTGITVLAILGLAAPVSAANWVIDFDTDPDNTSNLLAGDSIFSEKGALTNSGGDFEKHQRYLGLNGIPGAPTGLGVRISAGQTSNYNSSDNATWAVGYDSSGAVGWDPDLEETVVGREETVVGRDGFNVSNLGGHTPDSKGYRNILIIQEIHCGNQAVNGSCTDIKKSGKTIVKSDDEAHGGILKFDFTDAVNLVGMNIFDFEEKSSGKVLFTYADADNPNDTSQWGTLDIPVIGDSTVAFMDFGNLGQNIISMRVECAGSCAIDNITGATDTPPGNGVPEPGALALFGVGIAGMALVRRRRRLAA